MKLSSFLAIALLVLACIGVAGATSSITGITNNTATCAAITWGWTNPTDADFNHTMIYQNNTWLRNASNSTISETWSGLPAVLYTFSSKTVNLSGTVNATWVNGTATPRTCSVCPTLSGLVCKSSKWNVTCNWTTMNVACDGALVYYNNTAQTNYTNSSIGIILEGLPHNELFTLSLKGFDLAGADNDTWSNITVASRAPSWFEWLQLLFHLPDPLFSTFG